MTRRYGRNPRLTALIALGIANHVALSGSRVVVSLYALHLGASSAVVGLLLALAAVALGWLFMRKSLAGYRMRASAFVAARRGSTSVPGRGPMGRST